MPGKRFRADSADVEFRLRWAGRLGEEAREIGAVDEALAPARRAIRSLPESAQRRTVSVLTPSNSATCPTRYVFTVGMVPTRPSEKRAETSTDASHFRVLPSGSALAFTRHAERGAGPMASLRLRWLRNPNPTSLRASPRSLLLVGVEPFARGAGTPGGAARLAGADHHRPRREPGRARRARRRGRGHRDGAPTQDRQPRARGRAAVRGRLRRRTRLATHAGRSGPVAAGGGGDRRPGRGAPLPHRPRPGRTHPGGERGVDRRRDHRDPIRARSAAAARATAQPDRSATADRVRARIGSDL